jgi:hypothetical protein
MPFKYTTVFLQDKSHDPSQKRLWGSVMLVVLQKTVMYLRLLFCFVLTQQIIIIQDDYAQQPLNTIKKKEPRLLDITIINLKM